MFQRKRAFGSTHRSADPLDRYYSYCTCLQIGSLSQPNIMPDIHINIQRPKIESDMTCLSTVFAIRSFQLIGRMSFKASMILISGFSFELQPSKTIVVTTTVLTTPFRLTWCSRIFSIISAMISLVCSLMDSSWSPAKSVFMSFTNACGSCKRHDKALTYCWLVLHAPGPQHSYTSRVNMYSSCVRLHGLFALVSCLYP